jgi:hypothetical protein
MVERWLFLGILLLTLTFVWLEVTLFLVSALFPD